jgi:Ca-activated chloride channel family protein
MLTLAHPWLLLLLPAPILVRLLLPAYAERRTSVRTPFFSELATATGLEPSPGAVVLRRTIGQWLLLPLCWVLLVTAMTRPQWVGEPIEQILSARDLMLLVDLSGSMGTTDFTDPGGQRVDRLSAVKDVLEDFVANRETDRLGLILFGNAAFLQVPFTLDHDVFLQLLDEAQIGMAGPQTMLGDAIGLAIKAFDASDAEQRTAILLTDGNDTGSKVPPLKAADIASQNDITLHTIGVGDPAAAGEAPLDEDTLRGIADATGGRYFRANDRDQLEAVYSELDQLEPLDYETNSYRPTHELFQWPMGAFLVLVMGYHVFLALWTLGSRARRTSAAQTFEDQESAISVGRGA